MNSLNNMTGKTKFEKELKQKLDDYQPANAQSNWNGIKQKIPAQKTPPWLKSVIIAGSAVVISAVVLLSLPDKADQTVTNQTASQTERTTEIQHPGEKPVTDANTMSETNTSGEDAQPSPPVNEDNTYKLQEKPGEPEKSQANNSSPVHQSESDTDNTENKKETQEADVNGTNEPENTLAPEDAENTSEQRLMASVSNPEDCLPMEVEFTTTADPELYHFEWHFGDGNTSKEISPVHIYTHQGEYKPALYLTPRNPDNEPRRISIETLTCHGIENAEINFVKNKNLFTFSSGDSGDVFHLWNIDGNEFNSARVDYEFKRDAAYQISLLLKDEFGCTAETTRKVDVEIEHNYFVPNAVKPSSNGVNASFGPVGENLRDFQYRMLIFDKNGQLVFETKDINRKWSGINQRTNEPAEAGVYLWKITTRDNYGNVRHRRGQVTLLRQ